MLNSPSSIGWLVSNVVSNDHQELFDTELASSRLRAGVCIKGCLDGGFNVLPLNFREPSHRPELVYMAKYVPDSNTGKYLDDSGTRWQIWLDKVAALKGWGAKLVVDYTDNHFQNPNIVGDFYRTIQPNIDALVVPSTRMLGHLKGSWDGPVEIIPEPVEVNFVSPDPSAEKKSQPLTALWFGHVTNLEYLFRFVATDLHRAPPERLIILTNNSPTAAVQQAAQKAPKATKIALGQWTLASMQKAAQLAHYAIIPSDKNDSRKNGASPGRLLTSLALGLPTVAEPLESYLPFANYFQATGTQESVRLMQDPFAFHAQVQAAQPMIRQSFTIRAIGKQWAQFTKSLFI